MTKQNELEHKWIEFKRQEDVFKKARLEVEAAILDSVSDLPEEGAYGHKEMLTITTGYSRKFDQDELLKIYNSGTEPFPFKIEFKEDRANSKALEDMAASFWKNTYDPLLTEKPKKPSFKVR